MTTHPQPGDLVKLTGAYSVDQTTVAVVTRADVDRAGCLLIVEWAGRRLSIDSTKVTPVCTHGEPIDADASPFTTPTCPHCRVEFEADCRAEHEAEMYAEGAWLRAAEAGYPGYADDPRELEREANDPQVNGDWMVG